MIRSKIDNKSSEIEQLPEFPVLRRRKHNEGDPYIPSFDHTFVVLFTNKTDGFVIHKEKLSSKKIGYGGHDMWGSYSDPEAWETLSPLEQVVLSND